MNVPLWLWLATIGGLAAVILADLFLVDHKPHAVTAREATRWVLFYVALAVAFGIGLWFFAGGVAAGEFFAGYITEYSLSVDNLFVFVIIMAAFKVPAVHQHRVLLVGIVIALVMRGGVHRRRRRRIHAFSWVFYLFAAVLVVTAVNLARQGTEHDEEFTENAALRLMRRVLPVTPEFHGARSFVHDRRPAHGHPDAGGDVRDRVDGPAVRARLDPRDLRPDPGAVPGLHRERLRADGPAAAVLPARRPAVAAGVPVRTGCR